MALCASSEEQFPQWSSKGGVGGSSEVYGQPSLGRLAPAELCPGCWVGGCVYTQLWVTEAMDIQSGASDYSLGCR